MLHSLSSSDDRCCNADIRRVVDRHQVVPPVSNPELCAATVDSAIKKFFQLQIDLDRRLLLDVVELSE